MPTDQSENSLKPKVAVAQSCVSFAKTMVNLGVLFLDGLKYASSHEWVKHEGSVVTIGIADHSQDHLGEVVFVELPEDGHSVSQRGSFGAVEGVKVTRDVNSPISGEVVEVNSKLTESPGLINSSPYEDGWMIKTKPRSPSELESLVDFFVYSTTHNHGS
ncbi:hypothetical protein ACFX12_020133 [Malus domestica]